MTNKLPWREREKQSREAKKEEEKQAKEEKRHRQKMRWTKASVFLSTLVFIKTIIPEFISVEAITYTSFYTLSFAASIGLVDLKNKVDNINLQSPIEKGIAKLGMQDLSKINNKEYFIKMTNVVNSNYTNPPLNKTWTNRPAPL